MVRFEGGAVSFEVIAKEKGDHIVTRPAGAHVWRPPRFAVRGPSFATRRTGSVEATSLRRCVRLAEERLGFRP
jgi:hypothetical protein